MVNASTKLLRALLKRGDYLERFSTDELAVLIPILEQAHSEVLGRVAARDKGDYRKWLADEAARINDIYQAAVSEMKQTCFDELEPLAQDEAAYIEDTMRAIYVGVSFTAPGATALWASIQALPAASGSTLSQLFDALGVSCSADVVQALQVGMAAGETTDQLVQRLRGTVVKRATWRKDADGVRRYHPGTYEGGVMTGSTRDAELLARTATAHVAGEAREAFYADNDDLIESYQCIETLDTRTCLICGMMDGIVVKKGEPRKTLEHFDCRRVWLPVLKPFRDLGIDADLPASTRASMDGQVADSETWADMVAKADPARRVAMLGKSRAALYKQGVGLDQMIKDGKLVPLKDLKAPKSEKKGAA